jgi:hypothetical protein
MQGHGYTQPAKQPPSSGVLVFLRVMFVVISVCSFGMLAWTMMLRLAIVTRRRLDWGLFAASIVSEILGLYLLGSESGDEIHTAGGWIGLVLILGTIVIGISYYLAAEIRHYQQLAFAVAGPHAPAYGYPQGAPPYTTTTRPPTLNTPPPMAQTPIPQTPIPHAPVSQPPAQTPPPPQRPAPARIDQVRAELDELSDYLRKHDGNHEGGR